MGCTGRKNEVHEDKLEQKWDYISLNDFKSTSCFAPLAYGYLWFMLIISVAVYGADTFTAVSLITNQQQRINPTPLIDKTITKWIFVICIILSIVNLAYEHFRAHRIMRRGNVAACFLDNLAARLECMRVGQGQGWKRFLVFTEIAKSKKGGEIIALFTYFQFQTWFRVIVCAGPRQVINALTLYAIYNDKLSASGNNVESTLMSFFQKIKIFQETETIGAITVYGMVFTVIIWVFTFLYLLAAFLFYIFYLSCYLPRADGGLTGFCTRKVNKRLTQIVTKKVNAAILDDERKKRKADFKAAMKNGELPPTDLKPSIPDLGGDSLPAMPMLSRNDTMTTLPAYTSRPGSPGSFELGMYDQKRPAMPSRTGTMASSVSNYSAGAPLMGNAAQMGYGFDRTASPAPSLPTLSDPSRFPPPTRTGTAASNRSFGGPPQPTRTNTMNSGFGGPPQPTRTNTMGSDFSGPPQPMRTNTMGSSFRAEYTSSPSTYSSATMPSMPQMANPSPYGRPPMGPPSTGRSTPLARPTFDDYSSNGRASPAPSLSSYHDGSIMSPNRPGYPARSATGPMPPRGPQGFAPQRNMTAPGHQRYDSNGSHYDRPGTSNSQQSSRPGFGNGWGADLESQRGPRY